MRHGEALSKSEAGVEADADRPLSPTGEESVKLMAGIFRGADIVPDWFASSPLRRAKQTAEGMVTCLRGTNRLVVSDVLLPDQHPDAVLTLLRQHAQAKTMVLVGHQPLLGRLVTRLVCGNSNDGMAFPPGGMCWLELPEFPRGWGATLCGLWSPALVERLTRRES